MRRIKYKYDTGDIVRFKASFPPSASCGLQERAGTIAVIAERKDYNGPAYRLAGQEDYFKEQCFAGRVENIYEN